MLARRGHLNSAAKSLERIRVYSKAIVLREAYYHGLKLLRCRSCSGTCLAIAHHPIWLFFHPAKFKFPCVPKDPLAFPTLIPSPTSPSVFTLSSWLKMRGTSSAKVSRKSESNGYPRSLSETDDRQDDVQPSPKRAKRGKYVSKAW